MLGFDRGWKCLLLFVVLYVLNAFYNISVPGYLKKLRNILDAGFME